MLQDRVINAATNGMVWIPEGSFRMGSNDHYDEERPVHRAAVNGFWVDRHLVTVAEFRRFVKAAGYVTIAESAPNPADYPNVPRGSLVPGSLVFRSPPGPVDHTDHRIWWAYVPGADWRHPEGPGSNVGGREHHPVTHVAYEDACAYAGWAGKVLPTEAEWEYAARGGLDGATYTWGNEFGPRGHRMANTWQGEFPWQNLATDGFKGTSPVGAFAPNGYGLFDMAGNVWEWTCDVFIASHQYGARAACCGPREPEMTSRAGPNRNNRVDGIPRHVIKGGSHLCAPNYCLRYRPAARQGEAIDTSTSHIGFRCIVRAA